MDKFHEDGQRIQKNTKVIGKFKDECSGYVMEEVYAIRAKLYHYVSADMSIKSGVNKLDIKVTANNIFDPSLAGNIFVDSIPENEQADPMTLLYKDCLFEGEAITQKMLASELRIILSFL